MCEIDWSVVSAALSAIAAIAAAVAAFRMPLSAERLAASLQTAAADRERKLDLTRRIAAYRSTPLTKDFTNALNEVAITFNDTPKVMAAISAFDKKVTFGGGHSSDDLLLLLTSMLEELGLSQHGLESEFFLRAFKPND